MEVAIGHAVAARGDVYLVQLDPTRGSEIRKTRPLLSSYTRRVERPSSHSDRRADDDPGQAYPWRVQCRFQGRTGFVATDQLRTVDIERLTRRLGRLAPNSLTAVLSVLEEMFGP